MINHHSTYMKSTQGYVTLKRHTYSEFSLKQCVNHKEKDGLFVTSWDCRVDKLTFNSKLTSKIDLEARTMVHLSNKTSGYGKQSCQIKLTFHHEKTVIWSMSDMIRYEF